MEIHVLTLFPGMFQGPFQESMIKRAQERGLVDIHIHDLREFAHGRHRMTDDSPYGGEPGMVLKPEPFFNAVETLLDGITSSRGQQKMQSTPVLLLTPRGRPFSQKIAQELATHETLILLCGHYEGVDCRVEEALATHTLSIGDYVLTGGELPAMVLVDALVRLQPAVLHDPKSAMSDSFAIGMGGLLQYPQYTRPARFRGMDVPKVLLSGDHGAVARWRRQEALRHTHQIRPDLLASADLTPQERGYLAKLEGGGNPLKNQERE